MRTSIKPKLTGLNWFVFKLWSITLTVSPIIYLQPQFNLSPYGIKSFFWFYFIYLTAGLVFSIPTLIICFFLYINLFLKTNFTTSAIQAIVSISACTGIMLTFHLTRYMFIQELLFGGYIMTPYLSVCLLTSLVLTLLSNNKI